MRLLAGMGVVTMVTGPMTVPCDSLTCVYSITQLDTVPYSIELPFMVPTLQYNGYAPTWAYIFSVKAF